MKTATVRQLRNEYTTLIRWLDAGEEIVLTRRGTAIARLVPEKRSGKASVDWSSSPAVRRDRSKEKLITEEQFKEVIRGSGESGDMPEGPICCGTSFLFSLYAKNTFTANALRIVLSLGQSLTLSRFNEFELNNALRFAEFRKILTAGSAAVHLAEFETDIRDGRIIIAPCNLAEALDAAKRLSSLHTLSHGHRAFDIIHVASALHLSASRFLTFDENQKKLARREGLKAH